jgi:type II secretory pathway component GspD/PulD (secretin)
MTHTVTRVYDIRDLLITIPDFDPMADEVKTDALTLPASRPSAGPATTHEGHKVATTRQQRVDGFVHLIEDTVDPESWGDHGGSIREVQGKLIVRQTKENQNQIAQLIEQIRKRLGLQVNVQARYISCDEASAKALIAEWEKATPSARPIITQPATTQPVATPVGLFLDDKQIEQFLRLSRSAAGNAVLAAPQLTLFNGQRAWVKVASQSTYVQGFELVKTADGQTRYDPILGIAEPGVLMDVAAAVSADRKQVTLTLRPRVSALVGWSETPWPSRPTGSNLIVSEPKIKMSELRTTVTIPDGRTLLLAGLEDPGIGPASFGQTQPAARPAGHLRALFLLVKPTIIDSEASEPRK